ncbi:MarR family winged helix-turn-helix transcriptional regulator [Planobispora siamensis]|uniref:MarR family transcriptional regulator n=1 Tax=Planobispora siamensis TaxID=936338 RepID=A0A8J3SE00_9ACTN|nr:MarR family transcriptional regulator [Planobispora siamensis]GIH92906.1 MarR family transcriptional regulator [Planobispora siamensis]
MAEGDEQHVVRHPDAVRADIRSWPTGRLLSVAARVVEGRFHDFLAGHGLTHAGLIVLHHAAEGRLTQRELATLCRVTDQTMSRTIEHLRRSGYVVKETDAHDRRRVLIEITPGGRRVLDEAREQERRSDALFGALDDYAGFRDQLITLITAV